MPRRGEPARHFMDRDISGHWYVVPNERRAEWDAWLALPEDDERAWDAPKWAQRLGGSQARVTFTDFRHE